MRQRPTTLRSRRSLSHACYNRYETVTVTFMLGWTVQVIS